MSSSHLSITARREGWWRAGRQWSAEPTIVAVADLSAEQLEMIHDDPHLIVSPAHPSDADGPAHASAAEAAGVTAAEGVTAADADLPPPRGAAPAALPDVSELVREELSGPVARIAELDDEIQRVAGRLVAVERRLDALAGTAPPPASSSAEARTARLIEAIGHLDRDAAGDWTASGVPAVAALERLSGLTDLTAADRDAAWAAVQSSG